ncbi:hypothetical protein GLOIN_2v1735703 [Rhizophagus clarus]|uniref:Uncharacterized protein n=1 Tax=Rhizophagus clarus TaxID=94130 RepID=A0A8H3LS00_9GLOM|nr:hypothetical protein GLOIN_2v1735703 [Rhizophagus clarus]
MWLERGQNLSRRIPEKSNQFANQALPNDVQKAIQDALAQQKTENQALVKKVTELQSQMSQQTQVPAPQTVEPVRQPKGPPSTLQTKEGLKNYYISEYLKDIGVLNKAELDADYPAKNFQRPRPQRSNNSARIDRMEEGLNETRESVNQLTEEFQKLNIRKPVARSNFNRSYFTPLKPIVPPDSNSEENDGNNYDEDNNMWTGYDPPSYTVRKKESDEWFSSLQYLNAKIDDLTISNSFLDGGSEFGGVNDATINALGWKADKPSDFTIKGNSKHITESLGWFMDVPISIKDKDGKTVTATGNFTRIDNGEPEPMLCLAYIIPTFSKAPEVEDPPKEEQDQVSTDSSIPTSEDLKKSA